MFLRDFCPNYVVVTWKECSALLFYINNIRLLNPRIQIKEKEPYYSKIVVIKVVTVGRYAIAFCFHSN